MLPSPESSSTPAIQETSRAQGLAFKMVTETVKAGAGGPGGKIPEWREVRRQDTGQGILGRRTVLVGWGRHDKHYRLGSLNNRNLFPTVLEVTSPRSSQQEWLLRRALSLACS